MVREFESKVSVCPRVSLVVNVDPLARILAGALPSSVAPSALTFPDPLPVPKPLKLRNGDRAVPPLSQEESAHGNGSGGRRQPDKGGCGAVQLRVGRTLHLYTLQGVLELSRPSREAAEGVRRPRTKWRPCVSNGGVSATATGTQVIREEGGGAVVRQHRMEEIKREGATDPRLP